MAHNLYRFYLYAVFVIMLVFAAVGLGWLLQPLLALTPLRGQYGLPPSNATITQGAVFFGISWLIAGALGGLHYWLMRRDMRANPDAGNQGVRSFFLNMAELIAAPLGIGLAGGGVIGNLGQPYGGDLSGTAATAIAALALFVVLELERRRAPAERGAALFFQRFHLYGVQFILLNILVASWIYAFTVLVNLVAFGGQAYGIGDNNPCFGFVVCSSGPNLLSVLAAALWMVIFWLGYGWLARGNAPSLFRRIVLTISFAYGVGLLLYGIYAALALLFRNLFNVAPSAADTLSGYNFVGFVSLGLLVSSAYLVWLRIPARQQPTQGAIISQLCLAILAALMAAAFFLGIGYALLNLFELPATPVDWAQALALIITGVGYAAFDLRLRRSRRENVAGAMEARRGFVFALLGAGVLSAAIGGATALYAWITAQLGSPLDNWPHTAHIGLAAFIVGAFVLALYLWQVRREQLIGSSTRRQTSVAPVDVLETDVISGVSTTSTIDAAVQAAPVVQQGTIEEILDDLLAGKVTRDVAAARIRDLSMGVPS